MSATMPTNDVALTVWGERLTLHVQVAGEGRPLLYLHPAGGLAWDPFLAALAERHQIFAPEIPGTSRDDHMAIDQVDDLDDLVLIYEEAIRKLDLSRPPMVIGQSFGGMLALELASRYPDLFERVIVLDPIGLWREDVPIANYMELPPTALGDLLFADPTGPAAAAMLTPPEDPDEAIAAGAALVWALGCTGKFVWPIPDRGLRKRLHRILAPTLIIWGEQDKLIPVDYAEEFHRLIPGSQVVLIPDCGHIPQLEQTERALAAVDEFLTT